MTGHRSDIRLSAASRRVYAEILHARLRLRITDNELRWAHQLIEAAGISPEGALMILNDAMDDLFGGGP